MAEQTTTVALDAMPPVKTRKPDPRRVRTRRAILEAASGLFAEQGVELTTVDEIADAAGLSVGTLYFHFGSKEGVLHALVSRVIDRAVDYLEAARTSDSALERLLQSGEVYFRFAIEQRVAFRFVSEPIADPGEDAPAGLADASATISDGIGAFVASVASDLEQAMSDGEIDRMPVDEALAFVWGSWNGVAGLVLREDRFAISPELAERALRRGRQALIAGLGGTVSS